MAVAVQTKATSRSASARRSVSVRCESGSAPRPLPLAAATFAAATLLSAPAYAKVIITQPTLKKVLQSDDAPAPARKASSSVPKGLVPQSAPAVKAAPAASKGESEPFSLDARSIALPASLVTVFGGFFAVAKADKEFEKFLASTVIKDSNDDGVGYEVGLKEGGGITAAKPKAAGTKKIGFSFGKK